MPNSSQLAETPTNCKFQAFFQRIAFGKDSEQTYMYFLRKCKLCMPAEFRDISMRSPFLSGCTWDVTVCSHDSTDTVSHRKLHDQTWLQKKNNRSSCCGISSMTCYKRHSCCCQNSISWPFSIFHLVRVVLFPRRCHLVHCSACCHWLFAGFYQSQKLVNLTKFTYMY